VNKPRFVLSDYGSTHHNQNKTTTMFTITDNEGEILGQGDTRIDAIVSVALELGIGTQEVKDALEACENGYRGEDALTITHPSKGSTLK
jgi:hypothetical protein